MAIPLAQNPPRAELFNSFGPSAPSARMQRSLKEGLVSGEIHWWFSLLEQQSLDAATEADLATLSGEERNWRQSFLYERDRSLYTEAHLLLRFALSQYLGEHPASLKFENGDFGRPELDCLAGGPRLRFSMSHTEGLATCAIVLEDDIGVDAERNIGRLFPEVSKRFASSEKIDLAALPINAQAARFLEYWTLKESYLKARGLSLDLSLDSFWFLKANDHWSLDCLSEVDTSCDSWRFKVLAPTSTHLAALAVRSGQHAKRTIRLVGFNRKTGPYYVAPIGSGM